MNIKLKPKVQISIVKPNKSSVKVVDPTRRMHTQTNQQKGHNYKRINVVLSKNPPGQSSNLKYGNISDRKSSKHRRQISDFNKTGMKTKSIINKQLKPTQKPTQLLTTQPCDKKTTYSKAETKMVKTLFSKSTKKSQLKETVQTSCKTSIGGLQKYTYEEVIGSGTFGVVYKGRNKLTLQVVAIKKVLQDPKYKNREYQILKQLNGNNVLKMKDAFFTTEKKQQFLNVIMDYYPDTAYSIIKRFNKKNPIHPTLIKIYAYQMLRGLLYLDKINICHRDIKPHNILIDPVSNQLIICDFGSAKRLVVGQTNISYICSRCYRAPELIFGATDYTTKIDIWSVGCVIIQMLLFTPVFMADSNIDQLVQIIKILGTPTQEEVLSMNKNYDLKNFSFPKISGKQWKKIIKQKVDPSLLKLITAMMKYNPSVRLNPFQALSHQYFDQLRDETSFKTLKKSMKIPQLFNFSKQQCSSQQMKKLVPTWYK